MPVKKLTLIALLILACASLVSGQKKQADKTAALKETLVNLEKQSWEAWQKRDGKYFQEFLSDDHVEVGMSGVTGKAPVVSFVGSPVCVVKSYAVDRFELHMFDANTALLTYHAQQDTACGGNPVPSPVWISSLFVKRGKRWVNAMYQQTKAIK
jgi:hypothetical protein